MEEWGEAYQALSWGPLIDSLKADLQPGARTDKACNLLKAGPNIFTITERYLAR